MKKDVEDELIVEMLDNLKWARRLIQTFSNYGNEKVMEGPIVRDMDIAISKAEAHHLTPSQAFGRRRG